MKIVYVEWKDSCSTYGWRDPENEGPSIIKSIGHLVAEDKECVVISSSLSCYGRYVDQLTIPKICIIKQKGVKI